MSGTKKILLSKSPNLNIMVTVPKSISVLKFLLERNLDRFLLKVRENMATIKNHLLFPSELSK